MLDRRATGIVGSRMNITELMEGLTNLAEALPQGLESEFTS
jgi:hypothetical protein